MADDPRAALASLEQQLRELAAELAGEPTGPRPVPLPPPLPFPPPAPGPEPLPPAARAPAPPEPPAPAAPALSLVPPPPPAVLDAAERVAAAAAPAPAPLRAATLQAGPFGSADPVLAFRDAVAGLPGVRAALLRRVEDGTAHIEVELS